MNLDDFVWEPVPGLPAWVNELCAARWELLRFIFEDATSGEDVADLWAELDGLDVEVSDWITTGVKEI